MALKIIKDNNDPFVRVLPRFPCCAVVGLDGALVEVGISPGLPSFTIAGLPALAVPEARVKLRCPDASDSEEEGK